jgi:hypothetical protein
VMAGMDEVDQVLRREFEALFGPTRSSATTSSAAKSADEG